MNNTEQLPPELSDILLSAQSTHYGCYWPVAYSRFYSIWGYFNRIYDLLYEGQEWEKIALFSLDEKFQFIWDVIHSKKPVREIAKYACVGDGKSSYEPRIHSRIASNTLRNYYNLELDNICSGWKCKQRRGRGWETCNEIHWPDPPENQASPEAAKYYPFGALLTIIYQIRNNLFHGSKHEYEGPDFERNKGLIVLSKEILQAVISEFIKYFVNGQDS